MRFASKLFALLLSAWFLLVFSFAHADESTVTVPYTVTGVDGNTGETLMFDKGDKTKEIRIQIPEGDLTKDDSVSVKLGTPSDGVKLTGTDTFNLTLKSKVKPPVVKTKIPDMERTVGETVSIMVDQVFSGTWYPDDVKNRVEVTGLPGAEFEFSGGVSIDLGHQLRYTLKDGDAGDYKITVTAKNDGGETPTSFNLKVKPKVTPPAVKNPISDMEKTVGDNFSINLIGESKAVFQDPSGGIPILGLTGNPAGVSIATGASETHENLYGYLTDNDVGTHDITITAKNAGGETSTSFKLTVKSKVKPPVAKTKIPDMERTVGERVKITVDSVFSGTWYSEDVKESVEVTGLAGAEFEFVPGVSADLGHGLAYNLKEADIGTHTITVTAKNAGGETSTSFKLTVKSKVKPPVAKTKIPDMERTVGERVKITVDSVFSGTWYSEDVKESVEVTGLPGAEFEFVPGVSADLGHGLAYNLKESDIGTHTLTVTAKNAGGETSTSFKLTVKSKVKPPVVKNPISYMEKTVGENFSINLIGESDAVFQDPSGGIPRLVLTGNPAGVSIATGASETHENLYGYLTDNDVGTHDITITAKNAGGETSTSFKLTVKSKVKPPVVKNPISDMERTVGERVKITVDSVFSGTWYSEDVKESVEVTGLPGAEFEFVPGVSADLGHGLAYNLKESDIGTHTITVTAKNAGGETSTSFKLTVSSSVFAAQCPATTPIKCPDGRCVMTQAECAASSSTNMCPSAAPIKCPDGRCVMAQTDCDGASAVSERSQSTVVQKEVSVSQTINESTDSEGNKTLKFTIELSCPADSPVECSVNMCAKSDSDCPR